MPSEYPDKTEMIRRRREDPVFTDRERLIGTSGVVLGADDSKTAPLAHKSTAQVERLARRLNKDPDEVAGSIPADTLRRTRWPMLEERNEDGSITFRHDMGIIEGPQPLVSSDKGHSGLRERAPRERDSEGKFV